MDFSDILFRLKLISAIVSLVFLGLAIYFIVELRKLIAVKIKLAMDSLKKHVPAAGGMIQSRWGEILRHADSAKEAEWKFAIIEADKLVDDILKKGGYAGDSMGERLMNIEKGQLLSLDGLWAAHKIRNKLAHDPSYFLRYAEARQAIKLYEEALRELNAL
jgi:hypothetical protein